MITVAMAIEDKSLRAEVQACLGELSIQIDCEQPQTSEFDTFLGNLTRAKSDLVLIDVSAHPDTRREVIQNLRRAVPASMIVALNTSSATESVLECFRAGADEYLFPPLVEGLHKALKSRETELNRAEGIKPGGKILAFLSAKGGCGATTLACHIAMELSRMEKRILLADLDINTGMAAFLMKAQSPYSITDALRNVHRLDTSYWKALVSTSSPNLDVIASPTAIAAKREPRLEEIRQVLRFVRKQYQCTVVDAGQGIDHTTMTTLDSADTTCLITTPELPALQQTKMILQKLLDDGYKKERIRLVLNRVPKRSGIRPEELQEMLGVPVYAVFPEAYAELHEAYSQGQLLPAGSDLGQCMGKLARKLIGTEDPVTRFNTSFFGFRRSRP